MGAEVLTVATGFVAVHEIEGAGLIGKSCEGGARDVGGVGVGIARSLEFLLHLLCERACFQSPHAGATPAGGGHHFDEVLFGGAYGAEFREESGGEGLEGLLVFAGKDDAGAESTVFEGVAGGGEFALLSDGATGFAAVGAGGFDLTVGPHSFAILLSHEGGWNIGP